MLPDSFQPNTYTVSIGAASSDIYNKVENGKYANNVNRAVGAPSLLSVIPTKLKVGTTQSDKAKMSFQLRDIQAITHSASGGGNTVSFGEAVFTLTVQFDRPRSNGIVGSSPFTATYCKTKAVELIGMLTDSANGGILTKAYNGEW